MIQIKIVQDTVFKLEPRQSAELRKDEQLIVKEGKIIECDNADPAPSGHIRATLRIPLKFGGKEYNFIYAYSGHIQVIGTPPKKKEVRLEVPYKSQLDNEFNPTGSCNVTSVAMCLGYFGVKPRSGQLEDQLYQEMLDLGLSRHNPNDLAQMVVRYGLKDNFTPYGAIEDVKSHLESGKPVITHGYFTHFGHIIVLVGYDESGFIVHDPYGEWFADGYRTDMSGEYLHYSYDLIKRTCMPDGDFWVHFISK